MLSKREPFAHHNSENQALQSLDFNMMKNFGKMFNIPIEFVVANETLNEVFSTEDRFKAFAQSSQYS